MKTWEFDVEMRVRKTLTFSGPTTEAGALEIVSLALNGAISMQSLFKWEPDDAGYGRHPVETIVGDKRKIVAVRLVEGTKP